MKLNIEKLEDRNMACTMGPSIPEGLIYAEPIKLPPRIEQPDGSFLIQVQFVPLPPNYNYIPSPKLPMFAEIIYDAN